MDNGNVHKYDANQLYDLSLEGDFDNNFENSFNNNFKNNLEDNEDNYEIIDFCLLMRTQFCWPFLWEIKFLMLKTELLKIMLFPNNCRIYGV